MASTPELSAETIAIARSLRFAGYGVEYCSTEKMPLTENVNGNGGNGHQSRQHQNDNLPARGNRNGGNGPNNPGNGGNGCGGGNGSNDPSVFSIGSFLFSPFFDAQFGLILGATFNELL